MTKLANTLVYEWEAWDGFLVSHLIADYCRMPASYNDDIVDIDRFLTPNIKAVLFQVNLSEQGMYPYKREQIIEHIKRRKIMVLNEDIVDITKSSLHSILQKAGIPHLAATPDLSEDVKLFVKSNLNWGGEVEERLPEELHEKFIGSTARKITRFDEYYLTTKKDLQPDSWRDTSIIIERYVSNEENSFYRVYALGESVVVVKAHSDHLIKKISGDPRDTNILLSKQQLRTRDTPLPNALQDVLFQFIENVKIDYFCLDIVHDNKDFYIVDLNTTPYSGEQLQAPDACHFLCAGLKRHIDKQAVA